MKKEDISVFGAGFSCVDIIKAGNHEEIMPGGTAANVLSILALLGIQAVLIGADHNDELGQWLKTTLMSRGLRFYNFTSSHTPVPRIIEYLDVSGRHEFKTICPVCGQDLAKNILPHARHIKFSVIQNVRKANLFYYDRMSDGIRLLISQNQKGWNFYEPNSCRIYKTFLEAAKNAHIFKFSQDRIPSAHIERLVNDLQESNVQLVIVSMGKSGFRFSYRDSEKRLCDWIYVQATVSEHSVDDSGAGDWMTAVFLYLFLQQYPFFSASLDEKKIWEMLEKAKEIAAYQCGFLGAQGIMYNQVAVQELGYQLGVDIPVMLNREYHSAGKCECCKL